PRRLHARRPAGREAGGGDTTTVTMASPLSVGLSASRSTAAASGAVNRRSPTRSSVNSRGRAAGSAGEWDRFQARLLKTLAPCCICAYGLAHQRRRAGEKEVDRPHGAGAGWLGAATDAVSCLS